jgi:hypothetical protein
MLRSWLTRSVVRMIERSGQGPEEQAPRGEVVEVLDGIRAHIVAARAQRVASRRGPARRTPDPEAAGGMDPILLTLGGGDITRSSDVGDCRAAATSVLATVFPVKGVRLGWQRTRVRPAAA